MTPRTLIAAFIVLLTCAAPCAMAQGTQSFCERRSFETAEFMVCKFDTRTDSLLLTSQYRKFKELEKSLGGDAADVRFAMNAGMYDKAGAPIGLLVAGGKELKAINTRTASGNFYLKPNGVFWVDTSGAHAAPTDIYVAKQARPDWATQSGPMLVIGGALHPDIQDDGPSRYLRNGVGVSDAHTALFVISEAPVSFGKLARFFRDELKCPDALYLDGAVSSLWLPSAGRMDSAFDLGPMIVVSDRK